MPSQKRKFGDIGEKIAEEYLINKKYKILGRNYWKPWGEIDLVTKKDNKLVFVEVKTRDAKNIENYLAEYSVNKNKIKRLQKTCETYMWENSISSGQEWQIDIIAVAIDKDSNKSTITNHIENAIWEKRY